MTAPARDNSQGSSRKFADLRTRVFSAVVLGGIALVLLWLGGIWAAFLIAALAAAMAWEWRAMVAPMPRQLLPITALAGGAAVLAAQFIGFQNGLAVFAGLAAMIAALDLAARRRSAAGWTSAGLAYLGLAAVALLWLRETDPFGFPATLWIILVVAAADVGGYFAGRLIGGPKLWPALSPKKTWAGLFGGLALAFVTGGVFSWATTGTYFQEVCAVSAIAALLAQAGDLAESAAKRHFGVKDASGLIPGHGGALDRFDGLMAATLVAAAVTLWRGQTVFIW